MAAIDSLREEYEEHCATAVQEAKRVCLFLGLHNHHVGEVCLFLVYISVVDPDPDPEWIRIQWGSLDLGRQKLLTKIEKS